MPSDVTSLAVDSFSLPSLGRSCVKFHFQAGQCIEGALLVLCGFFFFAVLLGLDGRSEARTSPRSLEERRTSEEKKPQKPDLPTAGLPPLEPEARLGGPLASPAMAEGITYADLDIAAGKHCRNRHSPPQPGSKRSVGFFFLGGVGWGFFGFFLFLEFWAVVVLGDSHPPGGAGRGRGPRLRWCDKGSRLLFGMLSVVLS